jgi:pimeloyl-ACP methyl ester carboxylesterase
MSVEQFVTRDDVSLRVQTFGRRSAPAILMIHGVSASMLWWQQELCEAIAARGRYVIRYDQRDTGRSTWYPPGHPPYALSDLVSDAVSILDDLGIQRAHVVGRSMGVAVAVALGVDHAERVSSLCLIGGTSGDPGLPPMSEAFIAETSAEPDLDDRDGVIEHIVSVLRAYAGASPYFDERWTRSLAVQDVARSMSIPSALANHFLIDFDAPTSGSISDLSAATLVVHGELDPVFPLPHGESLRDAVADARLLVLEGTGHDLPPQRWPVFIDALVQHTVDGSRSAPVAGR